MTSALSITRSVDPPRAAFVDFPLGHTTGKPHDAEGQHRLLGAALRAFETVEEPGGVVSLPESWDEGDAWKAALLRPTPSPDTGTDADRPEDERTPRLDTPQYQSERDRELAEAALARGGCPGCVFLSAE